MKVLHLETGRHVYGGALQVLLLLEGLKARGVQGLLVAPRGSHVLAEAEARGLPSRSLPMAGEGDILFPYRFRGLIRAEAPDLVHLHSRRGADTLGGLGALWAGVPTVLTRRVDNPEPEWAVAPKYRLFRQVIAISGAIRRVLIRQGVPPEKIRLVHSALDGSLFRSPCDEGVLSREMDVPPRAPVVGMAAQFIPRKGHHTLLEAVPGILREHPDTRFLLFGRGPLREEVRERIRTAGLLGSVLLPGFREDLPTLLPCLNLLVHPATMEGLGVILLQAGAAGLPVVAARAGGIPEVVAHGSTGLLVPPGDPRALATAVNGLLSAPEEAEAMGRRARERVASEFSVHRMVEGNLDVYREVLSASADTGDDPAEPS